MIQAAFRIINFIYSWIILVGIRRWIIFLSILQLHSYWIWLRSIWILLIWWIMIIKLIWLNWNIMTNYIFFISYFFLLFFIVYFINIGLFSSTPFLAIIFFNWLIQFILLITTNVVFSFKQFLLEWTYILFRRAWFSFHVNFILHSS